METTFLLIRCRQGCERGMAERLRGLQGISDCRETIGTFDIIAKLEHANKTIISTILHMSEVRQVTPLVCHRTPELRIEIAQ
ncbi:MAG: hypothetical protein ACREBI_10690 [Nitrosotalea sp.]